MAIAKMTAIKRYFERTDDLAPNGGKPCGMQELKALTQEDRNELAILAAKELGEDLQEAGVNG